MKLIFKHKIAIVSKETKINNYKITLNKNKMLQCSSGCIGVFISMLTKLIMITNT